MKGLGYSIVLLMLLALIIGMTPHERVATIINETKPTPAYGQATGIGNGLYVTASHVISSDASPITIGGNPAQLLLFPRWTKINDYERDWAVLYCAVAAEMPPLVLKEPYLGETYWFYFDGQAYPVVFTRIAADGTWDFIGQPPVEGLSGAGVFDADGNIVAIISTMYYYPGGPPLGPVGSAIPVKNIFLR
jgi:hypothetical protein